MARFRLSRLAEADLARILETGRARGGTEGGRRYATVIAAAMRRVAADPNASTTRDRGELPPGPRRFHIRHARSGGPTERPRRPVHVPYCRLAEPELIEIVRVLHERMEPSRHMDSAPGL